LLFFKATPAEHDDPLYFHESARKKSATTTNEIEDDDNEQDIMASHEERSCRCSTIVAGFHHGMSLDFIMLVSEWTSSSDGRSTFIVIIR
jgi:hypothetical protein